MTRIKRAGPPVVIVALIAGVVGYILGCTNSDREKQSEARAAQVDAVAQNDQTSPATAASAKTAGSADQMTAAQKAAVGIMSPRDMYFPGTEELKPDEMRVVACGTGMPASRRGQAATCWLVELGNGDKFLFDIGTGSAANIGSLNIPYDDLDKVFMSHLHTDHMGDLDALWVGGWTGGRHGGLHVWGPSGAKPETGTKYCIEHAEHIEVHQHVHVT